MGRFGVPMCGIAGFSLSSGSKINARRLSHNLLCGIELRGNQASGFAFQSFKASGVFKNNVAGSRLSLRSLPRNASSVILHTRYATHGSVKVMANNHPVMSPDNNIALVHNGVIYNHDRVRSELPYKLAEVDTSVIPALLQKFDYNSFDMLDGDASVAWLDDSDKGTLRVARISHSPLFIAQVKDGSFVFASTEAILVDACAESKLSIIFLQQVSERVLYEIRNGSIVSELPLPSTRADFIEKVSYSSYGKYRGMTAGGYPASSSNQSIYGYDDYSFDSYDDAVASSGVVANDESFDLWLSSYVEVDGFFYDYSGVFIGDLNALRDEFEDYRYNEYWATKQYGYNPYSLSEGTSVRAFRAGSEVDLF
jgi:asparagine synthetase B (glutamine-hydrolysing)